MRYFACIVCFFFSFTVFSQKWFQLGQDIDGENQADHSGYSVSLSSDGTIVAIGAPNNSAGQVRVYRWNGTWTQMGEDIDGEAVGDWSGEFLSISDNGYTIAIGAQNNDGNGANAGSVRVYNWSGASWNQVGSDIDGAVAGDRSGIVSLSGNGNVVAIGSPEYSNSRGHVRI